MENLKDKTAKGLFWGGLNSGTTQVLNVVIGILLGRLLSPAEWAPIGMIAIFSAIAGNLQSSGFSTAIVNMKQPTDNDYNAVFWFNVSMSFVIYWVLFALAPLIALFFEQPCLTDLSRFIFLAFFISSFGISTQAYLTKNMMQREMAIINLFALVCCHPCFQWLFLLESGMAAGHQFHHIVHWSFSLCQVASQLEGRFLTNPSYLQVLHEYPDNNDYQHGKQQYTYIHLW